MPVLGGARGAVTKGDPEQKSSPGGPPRLSPDRRSRAVQSTAEATAARGFGLSPHVLLTSPVVIRPKPSCAALHTHYGRLYLLFFFLNLTLFMGGKSHIIGNMLFEPHLSL